MFPVTMTWPMTTPTLYKRFKNWNYCHTHGGNIDNGHTSRMCAKPGPVHNLHATRTNMMNGLPAGFHKTILPLVSGRTPHVWRQQHPPTPATWQQPPPPVNFTTSMLYAADDASRTLPPDALHGAAVWTSTSSACPACSSRTRTTGGHNDDALLCTVPSASSLLTIRGEQQ
jgi:hypothetical protein